MGGDNEQGDVPSAFVKWTTSTLGCKDLFLHVSVLCGHLSHDTIRVSKYSQINTWRLLILPRCSRAKDFAHGTDTSELVKRAVNETHGGCVL